MYRYPLRGSIPLRTWLWLDLRLRLSEPREMLRCLTEGERLVIRRDTKLLKQSKSPDGFVELRYSMTKN